MNIRLANFNDMDQLIRMRWDFTYEDVPAIVASYEDFYTECKIFLEEAISSGKWSIWVG